MVHYLKYTLSRGELVASRPRGAKKPPGLFVAYKFDSPKSIEFKMELEKVLRSSERLSHCALLDGHSTVGQSWAREIRDRIQASAILIADLSVISVDVLYECGFAWGLGCPILPVVRSRAELERLPRWITNSQIATIDSTNGWSELLTSVADNLDRQPSKARRPSPHPNRAALIKGNFLNLIRSSGEYLAAKEGLELDELSSGVAEERTEEVLNAIARASFLLAPVSGAPEDFFVHFAAGIIASRPTAGVAKSKLFRRVALVIEEQTESTLVADSARRYGNVIQVVTLNQLNKSVNDLARSHSKWRSRNA